MTSGKDTENLLQTQILLAKPKTKHALYCEAFRIYALYYINGLAHGRSSTLTDLWYLLSFNFHFLPPVILEMRL